MIHRNRRIDNPQTARRLAAALLLLAAALAPGYATAQERGIAARFLGVSGEQVATVAQTAPQPETVAQSTATSSVYNFGSETVRTASPATVNAKFAVSGYSGEFTPKAALHYGLSYSLGTVSCTADPALGSETCTVPITFQPLLPGGRRDALQLTDPTNANAVLSTLILYGIGEAPLALLQPGTTTNPIPNSDGYLRASTVGEDGTLYQLHDNGNNVYSVSPAGIVTELPFAGTVNPTGNGIAVDGAGTLYIAPNTNTVQLITYSANGAQGTFSVAPPDSYTPCTNGYGYVQGDDPLGVAFGTGSDLFLLNGNCNVYFEFKPDGTFAATQINPTVGGLYGIAVDAAEHVFIGGSSINEIAAGGAQSQINTVGGGSLAVDAAGTVYQAQNGNGFFEYSPSNYATKLAQLDGGQILGGSIGPDGTLYLSRDTTLDKIDRSQTSVAFGEQENDSPTSPSTVSLYNGGNQPLTLSAFSIEGEGFSIQSGTPNVCAAPLAIPPGDLCNVPVVFESTHSGNFSGTVNFTDNSLNAPGTAQSVPLSAYVYGIYVTADPASLAFGYQAPATTSATKYVSLTNKGVRADASFGSASSSDPAFTVSNGTCTGQFPPEPCTLSVSFSPMAAKAYSANITITAYSDASTQQQTVTIPVSGTGVSPKTPLPDSESIQVADSVSLVPSTLLAIGETITVTDKPANVPSTLLPIGETITITDKPANVPSTLLPIGETITVSDKPVNVPSTLLPIGETIAVADALSSPNPTTTTLSISPATLAVGQNVTYKATVARTSGPTGTPTGTVTFSDGLLAIGTYPLANGVASVTFPFQALGQNGTYTITAAYSGDILDVPSTGTAKLTANTPLPYSTATAVVIAPPTGAPDSNVTFSATVSRTSGAAGIPTGTVTFTYGGTHTIGTYPVGSNGIASVAVSRASTRPYADSTVVAKYNGDAQDTASTGSANLTVPANGPYPTVTTLALSPGTAVQGQSVTATVTVARAAGPSGTPTGKVTFTWGGTYLIGTATLAGGNATFTMPVQSVIPNGTFDLFATYTGDASDTPSSGNANLTIDTPAP